MVSGGSASLRKAGRHFGWVALASALLAPAACGDDVEAPTNSGGYGGSGGARGGNAGTAGQGAGTSGRAGATGAAGDSAGHGGSEAGAGVAGSDTGGAGAFGGQAGSGGAAGSGADGGDSGDSGAPAYPELLSQTGLYADIGTHLIASDLEPYRPAYELWSDGAEKQRWVRLPAGASIDSSDLDYWRYPVGTELFKEFSVEGKRIETRLLRKSEDGWVRIAYLWNEEETEAAAVPAGVRNALGTTHDVPSSQTCAVCHEKMPDNVLGFTLIQLAHDGEGVTLAALTERQTLSDPPVTLPIVPGDETAKSALGYLHANCGICHNPESFISERTSVSFWLSAAHLESVEATSTYTTAVGAEPTLVPPNAEAMIAPGSPAQSSVILRMQERGTEEQMPPVASEKQDEDGIALVSAWIETL